MGDGIMLHMSWSASLAEILLAILPASECVVFADDMPMWELYVFVAVLLSLQA